MDDAAYWLALHRVPGIGPQTFEVLLREFGTPRAVLDQPEAARRWVRGATTAEALSHPDWTGVEHDLAWLALPHHQLITRSDVAYPPLLREIPDAPPLLFVAGAATLLKHPQIAIVGARNPTGPGRDTAHQFAHHLAETGLTITSGFATGIDAAAHHGALAANGTTLAVIGTGPDRLYPRSNTALADHILTHGGAIISEFPTGVGPNKENFPRRNRIIAGLSLGTLVVEAAQRSGSLITARLAVEYGREVYALPGSIHNPLARGCHELIRQGAKLVETAQHVLEELGPLARFSLLSNLGPTSAPLAGAGDALADPLLDAIGFEPTPVDTVIVRCGLAPDVVLSRLMVLELHGLVAAVPGGCYTRVLTRVEP
ncbi:MAG: DNA-processing protein DprA [Gammaproteobacteria bacterium]|nr:DNA-processing protein DprA [Gammaproteobacteria bacterium]